MINYVLFPVEMIEAIDDESHNQHHKKMNCTYSQRNRGLAWDIQCQREKFPQHERQTTY